MKSKTILLALLLSVTSFAFSQKKELKTITESDLKAHLEFIASDLMQGREYGTETPGLEITAEYLRAACRKMGLKPGGNNYFQTVEMVSIKPDTENTFLKLKDRDGVEKYRDNAIFAFTSSPKNETIEGDIVFAGYGWKNGEGDYNDLDGLELKDKIVLIMTRNMQMASDTSIRKSDTRREMGKMMPIFKAGAKALIIVPDPLNRNKSWLEMAKGYITGGTLKIKGSKERSFIPGKLIVGNIALADAILKESGKSLLQLQKEINETGTPKSFEVKEYTAEIKLSKISAPVRGENVIGIVEGSDPVLKNECVVLSAHYDHLGMDSEGEVFNGADDNGSGTVALLEIAEAFTKMKKMTKRSIVFVWVTAEEKGLIGSDYYSQHPVFPLDKTLADINLDMVGRSAEKEPAKGVELNKTLAGPNGFYVVTGGQSSELTAISDKICKSLNLVPSDAITKAVLNRSDYYHFYKNGVPILGLTTGLHEDYHKVTDEPDKIDYNKMKRVTQYSFLVAYEVANKKKRIVVDNPVGK